MPSPEELNRIQKENLIDEQIEKDKTREEVYEAGLKQGKREVYKLETGKFKEGKKEFELDEKLDKQGLPDKIKEYFKKGLLEYRGEKLVPNRGITESELIETMQSLPVIKEFDMCYLSHSLTTIQRVVEELSKHEELERICTENYYDNISYSNELHKIVRKLEDGLIQKKIGGLNNKK